MVSEPRLGLNTENAWDQKFATLNNQDDKEKDKKNKTVRIMSMQSNASN